jgi:hypothetical protein
MLTVRRVQRAPRLLVFQEVQNLWSTSLSFLEICLMAQWMRRKALQSIYSRFFQKLALNPIWVTM